MTVLEVGIETAILTDCHCYYNLGEPVIMVSGDYYSTVDHSKAVQLCLLICLTLSIISEGKNTLLNRGQLQIEQQFHNRERNA